jgi:hypothetical protein
VPRHRVHKRSIHGVQGIRSLVSKIDRGKKLTSQLLTRAEGLTKLAPAVFVTSAAAEPDSNLGLMIAIFFSSNRCRGNSSK